MRAKSGAFFFGARARVNVTRRGDTQNDARYAAQGRTHARALNPEDVQATCQKRIKKRVWLTLLLNTVKFDE